jgi:hypothetical protein
MRETDVGHGGGLVSDVHASCSADWSWLLSLQKAGIAIVPTRLATSRQMLIQIANEWSEFGLMVRPAFTRTCTASAVRGRPTDPEFISRLCNLPSGAKCVVQIDPTTQEGCTRWSLTLEAGRVTAAYRVDAKGRHAECAPVGIHAVAARIFAAASTRKHGRLVLAQIGGVEVDGEFVLESVSAVAASLPVSHRQEESGICRKARADSL